ncbi:MAG TPA: dienelactone hydrolase family protein [Streptosporangiaceae bacterium]|nr:dienelactone hydrolase family protein [Streptosporangiaceae bacterium]
MLNWVGEPVAAEGITERLFVVDRPPGIVPGALWLPSAPAPRYPLVLLGHGGSGHKRNDRMRQLARALCSEAGLAAVAIDGPYHGDRVPAPLSAPEYQARIVAEGLDAVIDRMTADWRATVDLLGSAAPVDTTRVGYIGVSMGTRFGLPLAAAIGSQLAGAVFGKFGLQETSGMYAGADPASRIKADATAVTAPVLFHVQWHDELFARDGQLALFDLFTSPDKQLIAYPGRHGETKPTATAAWCSFISTALGQLR